MIKVIERTVEKYPAKAGERGKARMTIMCDEAAELPEYDSMAAYDITMGSIAYVIRQGKTYLMDSDNTWYSIDGASD